MNSYVTPFRGAGMAALIACSALAAAMGAADAQTITVPNFSFESPTTGFAGPTIDSWQENPKPTSYVESSGFTWDDLTGVFLNDPPGSSDYLDNLDGPQAAYLFNVPQVGFFQDYNSVDYHNNPPAHAFNATYTVGKAYILTVGLNGGGGGMQEGSPLLVALYYRDAGGNMVTIASATVVFTLATFPTHTHMTDFQVLVPTVKATDPWAGQHIGIRFLSTVSDALQGGYWDVDNVRLSATATLFPVTVASSGSALTISWPSNTGYQYQVQTSSDLHSWSPYMGSVAGTGQTLSESYTLTGAAKQFFRIQVTSPP